MGIDKYGILQYTNVGTIKCNVAGTAAVPERQRLLELARQYGIKTGYLVPEPDNKYDPDAVRVMVHLPAGPVQIGYLPNKVFACRMCGRTYKPRSPVECLCGSTSFIRAGIASLVARNMRAGINYRVELEIIGGSDGKSLGCIVTLTPA